MEKVRVAIIGLGCRGELLASIIADMEEAQIVAVCDLYEDRRVKAVEMVRKKRDYTPKIYADYREILSDPSVDAVIIATSWDAHIRIATDCIRAGKVTALEVGGAYSVEECESLVRTYEQYKTPFMFLEIGRAHV